MLHEPVHYSTQILNEAIEKGATDIHFTPKNHAISIYLRINGYRWFYKNISPEIYQSLLGYYKFISEMDIAEKRIPQNGTYTFQNNSSTFNLRLSTLPTKNAESLAIRILPQAYFPQLDDLFVFSSQAKQLMNWIKEPSGMILFTGPTGSGKTTTMYAILKQSMDLYGLQTITLEDPVEQSIQNILQVQVNETAGFSYDVGLKAALRHDPDLIMIGEIRDENTARFALRTALTGHLVLSTVHAKSASGTISRLVEMGINRTDLKESLIGIASQQLIEISDLQRRRHYGRAAILELLHGQYLIEAIDGKPPEINEGYQTFDKLRRKAYALGIQRSS